MNYPNNHRLHVSAVFVLAVMLAGTIKATTISTFGTWNGRSSYGPSLGEAGQVDPGAYASYGQTFTAPNGDNLLISFSIVMHQNTADPSIIGGYLMRWDGQRASGPVLYESGPISIGPEGSWQQVTFNPLNLVLTGGQQYVFIVSASQYFNGLESTADLVGMALDPYPAGMMVNMDNGTDISKWTSQDWTPNPPSWDTVFTAEFSPVPDPPSAILFPIGLAFLILAGMRRKYWCRVNLISNPNE